MKRTTVVIAAALALAAAIPAAPAHAQNGNLTRSFVSSAGNDSNPCTITEPCATFAHAYTVIGANGIIAALDPGKYGPIAITGPVTINGNGWAAITAPAGGNGITIDAGSGNVFLNGLEIDGAGAAYNGIVFQTGSSLTITNCTLQNFIRAGGLDFVDGNGILMQPTTGAISFRISNTTLSNNGNNGIDYLPPSGSATANGIIDHVVATSNLVGIVIDTSGGGGSTTVAISNTISSNNGTGITFTNASSALEGSIDNSTISGNTTYGIDAEAASDLEIGRSVITYNGTGIFDNTTPDRVYSYGDNRINSNNPNIGGSHGSTLAQSHALQ